MPILVDVAQKPDIALHGKYPGRITYGQLGERIDVFPANVGSVCGHIRDEITIPLGLPFINCLVVNAQTGYPAEIEPGDTRQEAKHKFAEFNKRVYEYERWDELLEWDSVLDRLDQTRALFVEELESKVKKYPDDIDLKKNLAAALLYRYLYGDEGQEALNKIDLERVREIVQDLPPDRALYVRAYLALCDGNQEQSNELLIRSFSSFDKNSAPLSSDELWFWIIYPFTLSRELASKLADVLRKKWPESAVVYTLQGLAKALCEGASCEDGIDDFILALDQDQDYWYAADACAAAYYNRKIWRAARNYYHQALKSETAQRLPVIQFEFAWVLSKLKDYQGEEEHYRLCLELDPDYAYARNNLGWSLSKQGRYEEALEVFEETLKRGNDGKYPLRNKARTLRKLARFQEAIATWQQDIYRGELTKSAQEEIAELEALIAEGGVEPPPEASDAEDKEAYEDIEDLSEDDEHAPVGPAAKSEPSKNPSIASSERWLECMIEEQIRKDNVAFGYRLKMYDEPEGYGRQFPIAGVGRIDLLAENIETDDLVVIELKKGQFGTQAIEQISRYMTWVCENLVRKGQKVRGIVCVYRASPQLRREANKISGLELFEYGIEYKRIA